MNVPLSTPSNTKTVNTNIGMPLDVRLIDKLSVNRPALDRRVNSLVKRRSVKNETQVAWLLQAVRLMDLTSLSGDDTKERIQRLCAKGITPISQDIATALSIDKPKVAAICVYPLFLSVVKSCLGDSGIQSAVVSAGFPAGLTAVKIRLEETRQVVFEGADEVDIVISRHLALAQNWQGLYDEIKQHRQVCQAAKLKVILATGELGCQTTVMRVSMVAMMAGADFIKTSTGKESENATLATALTMVRAIRIYQELSGFRIGFKPAGGITSAGVALQYMVLMNEELGPEWLTPELFRFGASSLLNDIERQLFHAVTGGYSATYRHRMG